MKAQFSIFMPANTTATASPASHQQQQSSRGPPQISTVAAAPPPPRNKLRTQLKCIEIQLSGSYLELGSTEVCWQRRFSDLSSIQFSKPIFAEMS